MKKREDPIRDELDRLSPFLSGLKDRKEGFEVPPGYFRELPAQVIRRIRSAEKAPASRFQFWKQPFPGRLRLAGGLTALLLLCLTAYWIWEASAGLQESTNSFRELSNTEVHAYIQSHIDQFDTELVLEAVQDDPEWVLLPETNMGEEKLDEYFDQILNDLDQETMEELL